MAVANRGHIMPDNKPMPEHFEEGDSVFEGGFDPSIFTEEDNIRHPITEKMWCQYCRKICRDPQQRKCGHMFCRTCLNKLKRSTINNPEPVYCPACVAADDVIPDSQLQEIEYPSYDYALLRILVNKKVHCPQPGCDFVSSLKDYEQNHELTCPHAYTSCPNQCGENVHVTQLAAHLEDKCTMRRVTCRFCGQEYPVKNEKEHASVCPSRPTECEMCGYKASNRDELRRHREQDCAQIKCPIACSEPIPRADLDDHFLKQMPRHMIDIGDKLDKLKLEMKRLEQLAVSGSGRAAGSGEAARVDDKKVVELLNAVMDMNDQVKTLDNICTVFKVEFEKLFDSAIYNKQRVDQLTQVQQEMQDRLQRLEQAVQIRDVQLMERDLRLKALEEISYDGTLVWRIENFSECRRKAREGEMTSIYSPSFYTSRCGYKLCARLYLNGDGIGKGTHISFFFVVMRGKYDGLLRWPFQQKVTMMLLDYTAQHHIMDAFRPDSGSASFHKPKNEMNVASGCPLFMPLSALNEKITNHVRDDVAYFKIIVDCSDIPY